LKRKIITTADGSKTIQIAKWNEQYHSIHGAIREANHVFIKQGLKYFYSSCDHLELPEKISVMEIGFGTGLNAFITLLESHKLNINIHYLGIEAYPVAMNEVKALNYPDLISIEHKSDFHRLHEIAWEEPYQMSYHFSITKRQQLFEDINLDDEIDLIYFDAFGPRVQPQLWTERIFENMFKALKPGGVLVTYSAKGSVRRAMQHVGFTVERLEGPPGKRQMLRASK
jgi:tRNA U34 5-methylaminomethyl-2-thiouridine-forming methyltransferase MnmC